MKKVKLFETIDGYVARIEAYGQVIEITADSEPSRCEMVKATLSQLDEDQRD